MIRIGIMGYGNLARGVESAALKNEDMELVAVFTRRDPSKVKIAAEGVGVYPASQVLEFKDKIDVLVLCGGSATDLMGQTPEYAKYFNTVDSFDTHVKIPQHFAEVRESAEANGFLSAISCGWDPGLFSINRIYADAVLPGGSVYTFWGKGVSQGHSDAVRRIDGVIDARQYTIPVEEAMQRIRAGETPDFTARQKHTRYCYVVAEEGADKEKITEEIVNMPNYFDEYDTTVEFISAEEMAKNHSELPHGGIVMHSGKTGPDDKYNDIIEYRLQLDSNPYFTGSVIAAVARAVYRMHREGRTGCITMADIAPAYLINKTGDELLHSYM